MEIGNCPKIGQSSWIPTVYIKLNVAGCMPYIAVQFQTKQGMSDCKTVSYFLTGIIFLTRAPIPYFAIIVQEQDGTTSRRRLCNSQRL